jgi:phage gp36-like protein
MPSYLTLVEFRLKTLLPAEVIDEVEARTPGFVDEQISMVSARFDSRFAKRYDVPFQAPYPTIVTEWITHIVSLRTYMKRGVYATDTTFAEYKAQHDQAVKEVEEAADSDTGKFELPLRADTNANGIMRGSPRSYTEAGPYVFTDVQADIARDEDANRTGTLR